MKQHSLVQYAPRAESLPLQPSAIAQLAYESLLCSDMSLTSAPSCADFPALDLLYLFRGDGLASPKQKRSRSADWADLALPSNFPCRPADPWRPTKLLKHLPGPLYLGANLLLSHLVTMTLGAKGPASSPSRKPKQTLKQVRPCMPESLEASCQQDLKQISQACTCEDGSDTAISQHGIRSTAVATHASPCAVLMSLCFASA